MSEEMTAEKAKELRKPFPASAIGKLPKGGTMLDYVGHAATTDRLLSVDREWSWEPMAVDGFGNPQPDQAGNLWIRLTVCGVTRIGVGDGKSMKERIGDAIRNAAMRFGCALDLWAKEDLHEIQAGNVGQATEEPPREEPAPKAMTARSRGEMFALFGQKGVPEEAQLAGINAITAAGYESRGDLSEEHAKQVIAALRKRPDATTEGDPA